MHSWSCTLLELIRRTSCDLPADVEQALRRQMEAEAEGSRARATLAALLTNTTLARDRAAPLCQDTGTLTFWWQVPAGADAASLESAARDAVAEATRRGWLRRNTLDGLTGRSIDDNVAEDNPVCHFEQSGRSDTVVWLLQKGGGCENVSRQYSLPDDTIGANRDLDGVRKCVLTAIWQAQGHGCAPGIIGVCVGGDRATGYEVAKQQLLRPLSDRASESDLAVLEERILAEGNELGIGPMGLAGRTTVLGVKLASRPRVPASFFVTVAYGCWACRRRGVRVQAADGKVIEWLG